MKSIKLLFLSLLIAFSFSLTADAYNFTRDLEFGARGEDVTQLQQMLSNSGYLSSDLVTGYFGESTKNALIRWQISSGISPAAGYFGTLSRNILSRLNSSSNSNSNVSTGASVSSAANSSGGLSEEQIRWVADTLLKERIINRNKYNKVIDALKGPAPAVSLRINGVSDLTVTPGQNYTYQWASNGGKKFSAKWETTAGQSSKCGGASGNLNFINSANGSKDGLVKILSSNAGCVWKITYEVVSENGTKAESVAFLRVPATAAAPAPTASLLVNNSNDVTVNPGDRYVYSWTSTNGETASGKWTSNDASKCVAASGIMRNMNTLRGSYTATDTITSAHAGCVWTVTYEVKNAYGEVATSVVTVRVPAANSTNVPAPTARLRVNGETNATVEPGESYTYSWTSTNGVSASANWTSNNSAKCGASGTMAGINTLSGSKSNNTVITENHRGCIWTVNYVVKNANNVAVTSTVTLRVQERAAAPAPTASLKISNQSNLTVRPGDSYNYSWTSTNSVSAKGTWRTTSGDSAKCGASGTMSGMNTLIGSLDRVQQITSAHAGCVWEVKYEVENEDGEKVSSTATLRVPN